MKRSEMEILGYTDDLSYPTVNQEHADVLIEWRFHPHRFCGGLVYHERICLVGRELPGEEPPLTHCDSVGRGQINICAKHPERRVVAVLFPLPAYPSGTIPTLAVHRFRARNPENIRICLQPRFQSLIPVVGFSRERDAEDILLVKAEVAVPDERKLVEDDDCANDHDN